MRRNSLSFLGAALLSGFGGAAVGAETTTPEGAKAIEDAYAAYVSRSLVDKGVVTVAPQGEDYVVTWDFAKAIAAAGVPTGLLKVAPFVYRLTPTLGGGWIAKASSLPTVTIGPTGRDGREGGTISFNGFHFDGLYDPGAQDFWRDKLVVGELQADVKARSGDDLQHMKISENGIVGEMRVRAGEDKDSVDVSLTQTADGASQVTADVDDKDASHESQTSETRQGAAVGGNSVSGLRALAFADFWRFLVANAAAPASPETLRPKLEALLPLWRQAEGRVTLDDIGARFPGGGFSLKSLDQDIKMSGLAPQASLEWALALKDFSVELDSAPDWAKAAFPASLHLRFSAGVGGVDQAARLVLDDPELIKSGDLGEDTKGEILRTLLEGHPHVAISDARLSTPLAEATVEGQADLAAEGPQAHAKVTADSLDKVMELLANASESDPDARQFLFLATFVKGLARQVDGRLVWEIEFAPPNGVKVNGQLLTPNPPAP